MKQPAPSRSLMNLTAMINGCMTRQYKCQKILYDHYLGFAFQVVFRYIYRYDKAVDIVNDGFVKLFNHFPKFKLHEDAVNEKMLLAWLKKIMINTAIDELRKNELMPEIGGISDSDWTISDPHQDADQSLLYKDLIVLIKELPPAYRIVFNLYVIDGYSHDEISKMLGMAAGNSKSNLSRGRSLLRKKIKSLEEKKQCRI